MAYTCSLSNVHLKDRRKQKALPGEKEALASYIRVLVISTMWLKKLRTDKGVLSLKFIFPINVNKNENLSVLRECITIHLNLSVRLQSE